MDPCPVLVGREQELGALLQLLDAGGGVAIVSGEAGIGKSRLIREFATLAEKAGRIVLWGRPEEVAQPGPYALIVDLLESIAERGSDQVQRQAQALITELIRPSADTQTPPPTARSIAAEIRGILHQLEGPPLVALEDLHWADEVSNSVLLHLTRASRDDGHLIVASYRGEALERSGSLARLLEAFEREHTATSIELQSLSEAETTKMLEVIAPLGLEEEERSRIVSLGEGNPLFIEELADSVAVEGVPRSIELTVNARLQALGSRGSEVLRLASLAIGPIDVQVLAEVLGDEPDQVTRFLVEGTQAGLLTERDARLVFRHSLVRDAVAKGMLSVQRSKMHRLLALAIEAKFDAELELHSSVLALHFQAAGDNQKAAQYLLIAGDRALAFAATADARAHFSNAMTLSAKATLHATKGLAEVDFREGNEDQASLRFRSAANEQIEVGDSDGAATTLGRLAWVLRSRSQSEEVIATLDEGLALLNGREDSRAYVELLVQKGQMLSFLFGRFNQAKPILETASVLAQQREDKTLLAHSFDGLAHVSDWEGNGDQALAWGERATSMALEAGVAEVIGRTHNNHAVKLASYGRPTEGVSVLTEGRVQLLRAYGSAGVSALDVSQAWIAWLMGLPTEVASLAARGQSAWRRWRGYRLMMEVWAATELRNVPWARKRVTAAWQEIGGEEMRRACMSISPPASEEGRQFLFAETLLASSGEDPEQAVDMSVAVVRLDEMLATESFDSGQGLVALARAFVIAGKTNMASEALDSLSNLLKRAGPYPYLEAHAAEIEALIHAQEGAQELARDGLSRASHLFSECQNSSDRVRCERALVQELLHGTYDQADIAAKLRATRDLADKAGALSELDRIDALLRSIGVRPRAGRPRKTSAESSLSPREAEVAVLVASGETNAVIARELFLSERTVQDHITNALRKLGVTGRAGLATWATRQGLVQ